MGFGFWIGMLCAAVLIFFFLPTAIGSYIIFKTLLVRSSPEKWAREASMPEDDLYCRLYADAIAWANENAAARKEVRIESDGFALFGEYYDFGFDRAVLIIAGRTECCRYSCHFAKPYKEAGYNVLTIDNRCHGLSEGKYNTLGMKEYRDILEWCRLLKGELHNRFVLLHGICIGASTALFAATAGEGPTLVDALCADGMYTTFRESFKNHMIEKKKPLFPFVFEVMLLIRMICGVNVSSNGPIKRIGALSQPILFIHSREDQYSLPDKALELYRLCSSEKKQISWFPHGAHSMVRITDPTGYDQAVNAYLRTL